MKKILFLTIIVFTSLQFPQNKINYQTLDANNIKLILQNNGKLKGNELASGVWKILPIEKSIVFDHGPWVIGKIDKTIHLALSQWGTNYSPGPIINNQAAMIFKPEDSLKYRIYKISKGDNNTNKDYSDWPFEFGAPKTKDGKPKIYQDQTLWCIYNTLVPSVKLQIPSFFDTLPTMPLEINQLAYSKVGIENDDKDLFSNTVFFEWTIVNKGSKQIDSAYFSFWTDIDFEEKTLNFPAIDTTNNLGYMWSNKTKLQPVVGYTLLYGPSVPSNNKQAIFKGKSKNGFINLNVTSNQAINDDYPLLTAFDRPSFSRNEAWNIVRGLYPSGKNKINQQTNRITNYSYSGNPVTMEGWNWKNVDSGDGAGFNLSSGPFNLAPNDTQWVMMALVPALGKDYKESITILRDKVKLLKAMPYDSLAFGKNAVKVNVEKEKKLPDEFSLEQNYPNPFNPSTTIRYKVQVPSHVTLKVFDVIGNEVATLVDEFKNAGEYKISFNVKTRRGASLQSGIYFYTLRANGFSETKKMILLK